MPSRKFGSDLPFLQRRKSPGQLSESDFDLDGVKNADPSAPKPKSPPWRSRLIGWPAGVILGQLVVQVFGWVLFTAVRTRGELALGDRAALWVKHNSRLVTLVATLISTLLAGASSFLFSYAIRRCVAIYLYRPMSLETLGASVSISTRSVVLYQRRWKWTVVSLLFFLITGVQTSGWTALLTPVTVVKLTPLTGFDIDLSSTILREVDENGELKIGDCVRENTFSDYNGGQTESGYASAKAYFGYLSAFTLMEQTFNGSTGGILPAVLESEQGAVPPTMSPIINSTAAQVGLSTNYSMQQRGFTADIVCRFQNLTNETTPDLTLSTGDVGEQLVDMHLNTLCPNSPRVAANATRVLVSPSEMTNGTLNFLALLVCSPRAENYTFIVVGSGAYDWVHTTVCTAAPQLTTVTVEYGATINVSRVMDITPQDIDAPASISGAMNIANMFTAAQALESNAIGTQWMLINSKPGKGSDTTLRIIEQYLKGVFEYSGSVLRACIPGLNVSFPNGLPANMVVPTNGTFRTETFGWTYNNRATQWVLLPGTFLMVTTIILVIVAVSRDPGDVSRNSGLFDPTNPLHLMSAAVAGGLTFRGQERQEHKELRVVLTFIPGRGPALVRADNYKPLHSGSLTPRSPYGDGDAEI